MNPELAKSLGLWTIYTCPGTYVQAVTDEKREAQNKVVKMLLPGIRRQVI